MQLDLFPEPLPVEFTIRHDRPSIELQLTTSGSGLGERRMGALLASKFT